MADPKKELIDALRAAMTDLGVDAAAVERRLGWHEGTFETLHENETPEAYNRVWIALLLLVLERFDQQLHDSSGVVLGNEPRPAVQSIRSEVADAASQLEAFEGDGTSVPENTDPVAARHRLLESSPLVLSREVAEPILALLYRMYRLGGGEKVEPFDKHVQTLAKRVQRRGS